jgi:hypothetical protein
MHDIDYTMPSELLSNPGWVDMLTKSFDPSEKMIRPELNDDFKSKADLLFSILRGRLRTHIEHRVQTELQQSHWCFDWARKNLSIVSAYMVLFGHVKDDISCIDDTGCLLTNPTTSSNYLLCTNDEATLQGCYLYYDKNDGVWRRSGKINRQRI